MILDAVKIQIQKIISQSKYNNYLLKVWIYKEKCVVLDFNYKTIKFALDIEVDETLKSNIYLVERDGHLNFLRDKTMLKRNKVIKKVEENKIDEKLNSFLAEIFGLIDTEFKYQVSVIVPVYNREKLILKCIESLNHQTLSKDHFEVIFVDDCSTDNTVKVIQEKCVSDLNYSILKRPVGSGNASAPRNDGLKKAKGKYVFFLDSDDYISIDCLQRALEFSESNQSEVTYLKIGSDQKYLRNVPRRSFKNGSVKRAEVAKHHLLRSNGSCKYFKRTFLNFHQFIFDQSLPVREDKLFNLQIMTKTKKVSILADKDYVFITSHDGEHLVKSKLNIELEPLLYLNGFNWIFISSLDSKHCNDLYNAWMVIIVERLIKVVINTAYSRNEREVFFLNCLRYVNQFNFTIDETQVYESLRKFIEPVLNKDFDQFLDLVEQ